VTADPDPVERAHADLLPRLSPALRPLAVRALEAHRATRRMLASGQTQAHVRIAARLADAAARALELLARCQELDDELSLRAGFAPGSRVPELRSLAEETPDPAAARSYRLALSLQEEQLAAGDAIRRDRGRVQAALHAHLAVLERARLALLGMASARTVESASAASLAIDPLSALAGELESQGQALAEVGGAPEQPHGPGEVAG
jgi:hypothetical protein